MNSNDKNSNIDNDTKNGNAPVSVTKKSGRRSGIPRHHPHSANAENKAQLGNEADGKVGLGVPTVMTKRESSILGKKGPQIHESRRKVYTDKRCGGQCEKAISKTVRKPSTPRKQENKYSKVLSSSEKSTGLNSCKRHSTLKSNTDTVNDDSQDGTSKKTHYKTDRKKSLPKAKEVSYTILPSAERNTQREFKCRNPDAWRGISTMSTSKEMEKVDIKQGSHNIKKMSDKVNVKEKIKPVSQQIQNNADNLSDIKGTKKIDPRVIMKVNRAPDKETIRNDSSIDATAASRNGAARTRIFKPTKRTQVNDNLINFKDGIDESIDESLDNKARAVNPPPADEQIKDDQENKTNNSSNLEEKPIVFFCSIIDDKIPSPYHGGLKTPESNSDCIQPQESEQIFARPATKGENVNFSSDTSSKTSCKQTFSRNIEIDSSQPIAGTFSKYMEVRWDKNVERNDGEEAIDGSTKRLDRDCNEVKESLTVTKIQLPDVQDKIMQRNNLMSYGYQSGQQENKKYPGGTTLKLSGVDEDQSAANDDAKYNLMKALIHPTTETHDLKGTDNKNSRVLLPNHESDSVLSCRDKGFKSCCTISSSIAGTDGQASSLLSSVKESRTKCNNSKNCKTWNPHASEIYLKQPLSNTSDYIAINLKKEGCKHTKKYRHFKYEDRNMCCNMARYIKKIVSDERRYQEFEKKGTPKQEKVKIIIDENSHKTSKIRIVNDRSSVSVICHNLGRTGSLSGRKNNTPATNAESSGGESSGYKSFYNNSNTKNSDMSEQAEIKPEERNEIKYPAIYNPSGGCETPTELLYKKPNTMSSDNNFNSLYVDDPINTYAGEVEHLENKQNMCNENHTRQNLGIKYKSYDTKDYLSTFTNCMDVYLPCEITAYQVEGRKGSEIFQFDNKDLVEKDLDDAELHIGKYLTAENSYSNDDLSEGEESSKQPGSVEDFETATDRVIMIKEPDNLEYESLEFIVTERLLETDIPSTRTNSTEIPAAPARHRIVTSLLDMKPNGMTDSSDVKATTSHVKFMSKNDISVTNVQSSNVDIQMNSSTTTVEPLQQKPTEDIPEETETHRTSCLERWKNKHERLDDPNTVHELWANKKSNVDISTDTDSQISGKAHVAVKCDHKKHETSRFKFNIFKRSDEKKFSIPLDQLPKPPSSFLENSAPSTSSINSSMADSNASESNGAENSRVSTAPIQRTISVTKPHADTEPTHSARGTHADAFSNEHITHLRSQANSPTSTAHKDTETHPESSIVPTANETLFKGPQGMYSGVSPPASALPPPYPFCCPMAPYMMQHWQNNQHPPPTSRVPLPEVKLKPTSSTVGREPPPPGMVPIPWFLPMQFNNPPQSIGANSEMLNNLPPPEWSMMPRGYAPCLPCSKTPELHSRRKDSMSYVDDEPGLESRDKRQDGKKKRASNKLCKIFRRRNTADVDTLNENDKPEKYHRIRSAVKLDNVQVVKNGKQILDDRSIWDSPDIAGIVTPEEIGRCFRRGFRADGLTLSGDDYLCTRAQSDTTSENGDVFNFSDHDTPLDFLLALGFSVDEATAAIRDDDVRSRFKAALTEARIWVPHIATTQGTLLYLLAMKAKPKVMRYFLQLVESIVNKRITNAVELDAYLKILEKVEEGLVSFVTLFGKDSHKDDKDDTVIVEKQRRQIFYTIYKYAEAEAQEVDLPLTKASVDLLHSLAARYRSAIGPHLRLLACYIGEGLLTKDVQLEAAVIYLSRLDSADVKLADLEKYCGLPPSERRRLERITQTES